MGEDIRRPMLYGPTHAVAILRACACWTKEDGTEELKSRDSQDFRRRIASDREQLVL